MQISMRNNHHLFTFKSILTSYNEVVPGLGSGLFYAQTSMNREKMDILKAHVKREQKLFYYIFCLKGYFSRLKSYFWK